MPPRTGWPSLVVGMLDRKYTDAVTWSVVAAPGAKWCRLEMVADNSLRRLGDPPSLEWQSSGERECFTLSLSEVGGGLPAGWYHLEGWIQSAQGGTAPSCLYPSYLEGADGDAQIPLPEPDSEGFVRALVLFKYPLVRLRFCPAYGPARFRMGNFTLRRLTRRAALQHMLGRTSSHSPGLIRRSLRFAFNTLRVGVSPATDALYRDYRRRLLPHDLGDYAAWAARFDTLTADRMDELRIRAIQLGEKAPLISILLPVYETPERWLRRCIDSVRAQAYPRWQLCIADDASPSPHVMEVLREYAAADKRIRLICRSENGHISEASNSALGMASGEYIALLDHDDELRPNALLEVVEAISVAPDVGLLYSDEDKIDAEGRRFDPYFKPDFNADLLRSQNYICHFTTIRTHLVHEVGGFRKGFEGSQDHDLILRCAERLKPTQVRHIPRVLYHWRAIAGSTALARDAKDYASSAGARAVAGHLERHYPGARVEELSHGHYRVHWPLPSVAPKVSLIIPTRDKCALLRMCVESIFSKTTYANFEVVVVDNQSSDPDALAYLEELDRHERVKVLRYDAPFNYSAINNWAARQCHGEVIGLVNNDIEVISPDWLEEMVSQSLRPNVGAVGAMLYYPNDTIQHAGVVLGVHGVAAHLYCGMPRGYPGHGGRARVAQELSAVTGACLLVRRAVYEEVGGLDESLQVAFNDIDFCLRLRTAGYRNMWTPFAELYHHESASRGIEDTDDKKKRFAGEVALMQERWGDQLRSDPAYNVNLSLSSLNCELSVPPRSCA